MSRHRSRIRPGKLGTCAGEFLEVRLCLSPLWLEPTEYENDDADEEGAESLRDINAHSDSAELLHSDIETSEGQYDRGHSEGFYSVDTESAVYADDDETSEFEQLETLMTEGLRDGASTRLEVQNQELVNEVISHLADDLLVATSDLRSLVVSDAPVDTAADQKVSDRLSVDSPESPKETRSLPIGVAAALVSNSSTAPVSSETSGAVLTDLEQQNLVDSVTPETVADHATHSPETSGVTIPTVATSDPIPHDGFRADEDSANAVSLSLSSETGFAQGETSPAPVAEPDTVELPIPGIGICFGTAPGFVNQGIRLSSRPNGSLDPVPGNPLNASIAPTSTGSQMLASVALAGGVLAAANADRSPLVRRIIRRIRRSVLRLI